jgi:hypothetical protein
LNITHSKIFTIQGGILKYGSYYFIIVNGTGGASLYVWDVEMKFVSAINTIVLILEGKVSLEDVKINNQLDTNWVSPLVFSHSNSSSVTVNLHLCTISDSKYKVVNSSYQ